MFPFVFERASLSYFEVQDVMPAGPMGASASREDPPMVVAIADHIKVIGRAVARSARDGGRPVIDRVAINGSHCKTAV
jgi:UDP-N-acetylmuramyl pentapeptide synthase